MREAIAESTLRLAQEDPEGTQALLDLLPPLWAAEFVRAYEAYCMFDLPERRHMAYNSAEGVCEAFLQAAGESRLREREDCL